MGGAGSIRLGSLFGIRIGATWSWFLVLFALIYLLTGYFDRVLDGGGQSAFACAVAGAALFELSLVLHELGHALVARRQGIRILGIDLWFFGGVARLEEEPSTPGRELAVSAAGPAATALIAVACLVAAALASRTSEFADIATLADARTSPAVALLGYLAAINVLLLVFNLVPAYPLDGGRIARAVAWKVTGDRERGTRMAGRLGQAFGLLLVGAGVWLLATGDAFDGIYIAVLGWFVLQSAGAAIATTGVRERLREVSASDLMDPHPLALRAELPVLDAHEQAFEDTGWPWVAVVEDDGRFRGVLTRAGADAALADGRPRLAIGELLDPAAGPDTAVGPQTRLDALLTAEPLRRLGALVIVEDDGRLAGVVTAEQVRRALSAQA